MQVFVIRCDWLIEWVIRVCIGGATGLKNDWQTHTDRTDRERERKTFVVTQRDTESKRQRNRIAVTLKESNINNTERKWLPYWRTEKWGYTCTRTRRNSSVVCVCCWFTKWFMFIFFFIDFYFRLFAIQTNICVRRLKLLFNANMYANLMVRIQSRLMKIMFWICLCWTKNYQCHSHEIIAYFSRITWTFGMPEKKYESCYYLPHFCTMNARNLQIYWKIFLVHWESDSRTHNKPHK